MPHLIRPMRPEDARAFLEVHHAAVRGLASRDYSPEVIEAWAPLPVTARYVEAVRSNPDGEYRLFAEIDGRSASAARTSCETGKGWRASECGRPSPCKFPEI
jgi:hypothetical protein